ncbi:extracellular solute-binding protein [Paenibacillus mucilaginosus 3016]|uniref:Extracellular solute-binding protein n=1 Tax=Paenibacillus mucilaginosus 3016 TaxID=1116391 RepID=H6NEI7_9BACL|nr:extracellular solute-binding protein [Paenibacillus mucilaginosus]AFC28130.1 extracellular solute-binding protein [Paenibacillus mucilaginosus 3016]WFA16974.1 extracellular solute-binding protein [Paenibacillus mucilaginosus]
MKSSQAAKHIARLAALMMVTVPVMTACQTSKTASGTGEAGAAAASSSGDALSRYNPVDGKKYSISWLPYETVPVPQDADMVKYYEDKFNVDFDIWNLDHSKVTELFNMRLASGEIPDYNRNAVKMTTLPEYVNQGVLAEVPEEVIKKLMPNVYKKATELEPDWLNFAKVDGKIYGLPILADSALFRTTVVWRGDWLKKLGIEKTPDTLAEFEDALYKIANNDPDGNGKKDTYGLSKSGLQVIFGAFGYLPGFSAHKWQDWFWQERDGKLVYGAVQPEVKDALKLLNKWYKDGVIDPEFITGENTGGYWGLSHAFINSRIGFTGHAQFHHWYSPIPEIKGDKGGQNYQELYKKDPNIANSLVHGLPPLGKDNKRTLFANNFVDAPVVVFGKPLEKEPDKLGKILQILEHNMGSTKENYMTALSGVRGKHWESEDPELNTIRTLPPYDTMTSGDAYGAGTFAASFMTYDTNKHRNQWAYDHKYDVGTVRNKLIGALPSDAKYKAELLKMRDEMIISIITGDKPVDYFDTFVANWNKAGGEQLTKEANEWYANVKKK